MEDRSIELRCIPFGVFLTRSGRNRNAVEEQVQGKAVQVVGHLTQVVRVCKAEIHLVLLKCGTFSKCTEGAEKSAALVNYATSSGSKRLKAMMDQLGFVEPKSVNCRHVCRSRAAGCPWLWSESWQKPAGSISFCGGLHGQCTLALALLFSEEMESRFVRQWH